MSFVYYAQDGSIGKLFLNETNCTGLVIHHLNDTKVILQFLMRGKFSGSGNHFWFLKLATDNGSITPDSHETDNGMLGRLQRQVYKCDDNI